MDNLNLFIAHISIEKGLAKNTVAAYRSDLERFLEYFNHEVTDISEDEIKDYLKKQSLSASSLDRHLSSLKSFFKFLFDENIIKEDPTQNLHTKNRNLRLPKALTHDQIQAVFDAINPHEVVGLRNRLIVELLYGTGIRISESVAINIDDLDLKERWIKIKFGKAAKQRLVPVGSALAKALDDYLVRARPKFLGEKTRETALLLSQRGSRLTRQAAWGIIKDLKETAKLDIDLTPHSFRHTFATHLLSGGADIRVVQELLGHSVVTTTQIYTKVNIDQIRDAFQLAHPRAG